MPAVEVGRICVKTAGRENGKKCVIIDVMDKSFALITGPKSVTGVKRKRVNLSHIMPLEDKLELDRGASDEEVTSTLTETGKLDEMKQPLAKNAATQ
ncbi:MAG: 50S ribosomal protein L14e [Candidatus Bathyarchaeota archaeon]|nr:50S ribosomal protein L14e [Candidatus Bathyarchaeota archaeon]